MTQGSDARRPHDREREPAPEDQDRSQDELARQRPDSGGDADAAGTVEEREAIAADEDETWTRDAD